MFVSFSVFFAISLIGRSLSFILFFIFADITSTEKNCVTRIAAPTIITTRASLLLILSDCVFPLSSVILYLKKSLPVFHSTLRCVPTLNTPNAVFSAIKSPNTTATTQISTSIFRMCHTNLPTNEALIRLAIEYIFFALLGCPFASV